MQKSVGQDVHPGMTCAALGQAIVKATSGSVPGRHNQTQAQAMKDVLFALGSGQPKRLDLDPALRVPIATALADYAPDVHELLAGLDSTYVTKAGRGTPPWEAGGTHHLSVPADAFRKTLRAVAEDPQAYALLRMAETRTAAGQLAAVPVDATGSELSLPPTKNARALGILDDVADAATSQDADQTRKWHAAVFDRLITEQADQADPAGRLTATWLQELKNTPAQQRAERLHAQGVDMARTWAQTRTMDEPTRQELLTKVESSARNAREEVKH
ncbi:hypothetical protein OG311_40250 (plasmid) [Streptomyces sp. NBC_01343]|uniref:hypothetical protein n=1 Tax=Streptomyces sp. NBC_01343 TaxID=2903832 RepID=UPI002E1041F2|nr:hypothetical protein OG311_40250 [Streptomyces sp. NBC_01343]